MSGRAPSEEGARVEEDLRRTGIEALAVVKIERDYQHKRRRDRNEDGRELLVIAPDGGSIRAKASLDT